MCVNYSAPFFSIITPVYNGENFIVECIESVIVQDYKDWELLLIDDGSIDKSGIICDEFAKKDRRIQVVHKKNGGEFSSRHLGVQLARGKYITGLDQDDYIDSNYLQCIFQAIEKNNVDCVVTPYISFGDVSKEFKLLQVEKIYGTSELILEVIKEDCASFWCKTLKAECYKNTDYSDIPKGIRASAEDFMMVIPALSKVRNTIMLDNTYLHYRDYETSSSHWYSPKVICDIGDIMDYTCSMLKRSFMFSLEIEHSIYATYLHSAADRLYNIFLVRKPTTNELNQIYSNIFYNKAEKYEKKKCVPLYELCILKLFRWRLYKLLYIFIHLCKLLRKKSKR